MTETLTKDTTTKHPLPSGAILHLGRPSFAAAGRLRNALARAAAGRPFTPDEMKVGLAELKENPSAGGALVSRLLGVLASEDVEQSMFECLKQASYQPKGQEESVRLKVSPSCSTTRSSATTRAWTTTPSASRRGRRPSSLF
jgi:hypothetical protein